MRSRINDEVQAVIDEQWIILHGGPGANDQVNNDDYEPVGTRVVAPPGVPAGFGPLRGDRVDAGGGRTRRASVTVRT